MAKRTTHRSSAGKKLYAVRDKSGKFKDIQTYERAHRQDLKSKSTAETSTAAKKAKKAKHRRRRKRRSARPATAITRAGSGPALLGR